MKASDFTRYLLGEVDNHSLYVWGGQGELLDRMTFEILREMETSEANVGKVLLKYADNLGKGFDMSKARAFDCSGLGVYFFLKNGIIKSDMTANGLFKLGKEVKMTKVREGDFVVKNKTSKGTWGHIGYVVLIDGEYKVVEAKGRAYGVVISDIDSWQAASRPDWWETSVFHFFRLLRKGDRGEDVQVLQEMLVDKEVREIVCDGVFGAKTEEAVKAFQKASGLKVDGVVGEKTVIALGGAWG